MRTNLTSLVRAAMCWGAMAQAVCGATAEFSAVRVIDGESFIGKLTAVDANWNLTFSRADGRSVAVPGGELAGYGRFGEADRGTEIVLADGSVIARGDRLAIDGDVLRFESDCVLGGGVPLRSVAGIVFLMPADAAGQDEQIRTIVESDAAADQVVLRNGDRLSGAVDGLAEGKLQWKADGRAVALETSRLVSVAFHPELRTKPKYDGLQAWVGLGDGTRILARSLTLQAETAKISPLAGGQLEVAAEDVTAILPLGGRATYLSDLPGVYRHIPFLETPWELARDRSVGGTALRADGERHLKGLGMHSAARVSYVLDRPYKKFEAKLAIDDATGGLGSVIGRVYLDHGDGKWQLAYESPVVRGGEKPIPIRVDVAGAKRLSLLVDFADGGDVQDHADWLEARLVE